MVTRRGLASICADRLRELSRREFIQLGCGLVGLEALEESARGSVKSGYEQKIFFEWFSNSFMVMCIQKILMSANRTVLIDDTWLPEATTKGLNVALQNALSTLLEYHNTYFKFIAARFEKAKRMEHRIPVELEHSSEVEFYSVEDNIRISTRTLKNTVLGLLVSAVSSYNPDTQSSQKIGSLASINDIAEIFTLIGTIVRNKDSSRLSRLYDEDTLTGRVLRLIWEQSVSLRSAYVLQICFLLAHEQGHIVLGHFDELSSRSSSSQPRRTRKAIELEADKYAATILYGFYYRILLELTEVPYPPDWTLVDPPVGEAFFGFAYTFAEFSTDLSEYPTTRERIEVIETGKASALEIARESRSMTESFSDRELAKLAKGVLFPRKEALKKQNIFDLQPVFVAQE